MSFWNQLRDAGFKSRRLDEQLGEATLVYTVAPTPAADAGDVGDFMLEIAEDEDEDESVDALIESVPGADEDELVIASDPPAPPPIEGEDATSEDTVTDDELELDVDTQKLLAVPASYPNSLELPDGQVIAILREENYPHLADVDDLTLVRLSQLESALMARAVELGEAYLRLQEIVGTYDLWQAAIWVTGMHRDPTMREGVRRLRQEGSAGAARWLGWMVWPYTEELLGAANSVEDPAGIARACEGLLYALERRAALIRGGPESLNLEAARYPAEAQGIFRREGFRWLRF